MVKGAEAKAEGQARIGGRGRGTERLTSVGKEESGYRGAALGSTSESTEGTAGPSGMQLPKRTVTRTEGKETDAGSENRRGMCSLTRELKNPLISPMPFPAPDYQRAQCFCNRRDFFFFSI